MPPRPDYYAILQVHPNAEKEVINAAYRRLALKYHPDVNPAPEAPERMKEINTAYQVLSDPTKRASYDASRRARRLESEPPAGARTEATVRNTQVSTPEKRKRANLPWLPGAMAFGGMLAMMVFGVAYGSENAIMVGLGILFFFIIPWCILWIAGMRQG